MGADMAIIPDDIARQVIAPESYAEWDGLLGTFDKLRETLPVTKVISQDDVFEPFG